MYTYELTATGYNIAKDGNLIVEQPYKAEPGWVPFTTQEATDAALLEIAEREALDAAIAALG